MTPIKQVHLPWKVVDSYPVLIDGNGSWHHAYENLCVALILKSRTVGKRKIINEDHLAFSKLCCVILFKEFVYTKLKNLNLSFTVSSLYN